MYQVLLYIFSPAWSSTFIYLYNVLSIQWTYTPTQLHSTTYQLKQRTYVIIIKT